MKRLTSLLMLILAHLSVFGQNNLPDAMKEEALVDQVRRCRRLIYQEGLMKSDTSLVNELADYAKATYETDTFTCFLVDEYRLFYLLTGRHHDLLATVAGSDTAYYRGYYNGYNAVNYNQLNYSYTLVGQRIEPTLKGVDDNPDLTAEQKDFIRLFIKWCAASDYSDDLLKQCDEFLANYEYSPYTTIVRSRMRYEMKSHSNFSFYGLIGLGASIHNGSMANIDNAMFDLECALRFMYKRLALDFSVSIEQGGVKNDMYNNDVLVTDGKQMSMTRLSWALGRKFMLKQNERFYMLPSFGIGISSMSPVISKDIDREATEQFSVSGATSPLAAIELGYRIGDDVYYTKQRRMEQTIGLRYSWQKEKFNLDCGSYKGNSHTISVVWTFGFVSVKRIL